MRCTARAAVAARSVVSGEESRSEIGEQPDSCSLVAGAYAELPAEHTK